MKKLFTLLTMLLVGIGSSWGDNNPVVVTFGNDAGIDGLTTDAFDFATQSNISQTLSDGTTLAFTPTNLVFWAGNDGKIEGSWQNNSVIADINTELGTTAFEAAYFSSGSNLKYLATGDQTSTSTLTLTFNNKQEGDYITLYASLARRGGTLDNFSATGLDGIKIQYAVIGGSGFSDTKAFSQRTGSNNDSPVTIVKITGWLKSAKTLTMSSTSTKNGWQMIAYKFGLTGKGYKLKMNGTNLYVKFRISGYTEDNEVNATLLDDRGTIFKIESDGSGRYRFKWCNQYMKTTGSNSWNSGHGTDISNATWYLEAATGDNTYYIKKGESGNVYFGNDQATPAVGHYLYTDQSTSKRNIKWILEEVSLLPETSTSSNPKYYTIENARGYCYAQYAGDNTNMALVSSRLASKANAFWFEAVESDNLPEGVMAVKIHNAATNKCVASTNRFTDDGITWYLKADVYTGGASAAINSNSTTWNNNNYGWNNSQGKNAKIAPYSSEDIGSAWWIERLSDADWHTIGNYSNELTNNIQPFVDNPGNGYFQINSANATSLSTMISEAASDSYVTLAEYTAIRERLYNNFMHYPTTGYYRIKNNHYNKYMTYGQPSSYSVGLIATSNSDDAASVVKLTGSRGTYKLSVQGLNIQSQTNAHVAFPGSTETGVDFVFNISSPSIVSITNGDSYVDSNYDGSLHETDWTVPAIVNWQASSDPSKWIVEDATTCTVNLNSDGATTPTYYATFCAPFSYTVSNGTKAYTLEQSGEWLIPTEIKGEVAAGTPVLLKGTSATATLNIYSGYAESPLATTALTGTYLPKTIEGSTDYVLGKKDGKVGFYHWSSNNLAANRAYLAGSSNARGFALMFDDDATGIVAPIGETEEGITIYNLSGQRLNKMQKGINIVNGKKVLF